MIEGPAAQATISGGLDLGITTTTALDILPTVSADVVVDYLIQGSVNEVAAGLQASVGIGLENIELDLGGLLEFFNRIFGQVSTILDTFPLGIAIDILTQDLPVIWSRSFRTRRSRSNFWMW